jgi:hypothetical protein
MTTDDRYTDADVEWVAEVLYWVPYGTYSQSWAEYAATNPDAAHYRAAANAVLEALTAAGRLRGHCPSCECPDVPYDGPPPTHRLVIDLGGGDG